MKRLLCALALVVRLRSRAALADPKSDLVTAMLQFSKATSYHIAAAGKGRTMEADMMLPSKMHVYAGKNGDDQDRLDHVGEGERQLAETHHARRGSK